MRQLLKELRELTTAQDEIITQKISSLVERGYFPNIASLVLSIKQKSSLTEEDLEFSRVLYSSAANTVWKKYFQVNSSDSSLFQAEPLKLFNKQKKLYEHSVCVDEEGQQRIVRKNLDILCGHFFMRKTENFFLAILNFQIARNLFVRSASGDTELLKNANIRFQVARDLLPYLSDKKRSLIPALLAEKDLSLYTEQDFKKAIEHISSLLITTQDWLQKALVFHDLTAYYAMIITLQAELRYHRSDFAKQYACIDQQLVLAERAKDIHPGVGHFMFGYAQYNCAVFLLDNKQRTADNSMSTVLQQFFERNEEEKHLLSCQLLQESCTFLRFTHQFRKKYEKIEANGFPQGFLTSYFFENSAKRNTIQALLTACETTLQEQTAVLTRPLL